MDTKELFFYRIDIIDLMDFATEPEGINMSLLTFAKELKKGESQHHGIQKIINKTRNYLEIKRKAGSSGGKAKASTAKAKASTAKVCSSKSYLVTEAVTEAVTITEAEANNTLSVLPAKQTTHYDQILNDMNLILGTRFRLVDSFKKLVRSRLNEGMQVDDFSEVCRKMKNEWGSNPDMVQYLRPETLFGSKMNGYLGRVGSGKKMVSSGNQRLFEEIQGMEGGEYHG